MFFFLVLTCGHLGSGLRTGHSGDGKTVEEIASAEWGAFWKVMPLPLHELGFTDFGWGLSVFVCTWLGGTFAQSCFLARLCFEVRCMDGLCNSGLRVHMLAA